MSARLAHLSDIHVDERGRLDDLREVLYAFLEDVATRGVDLIVLSGDLYERRSTPTERSFLAQFLQDASHIAPVVGVRGNHDAEGDVDLLNRLETDAEVRFFEGPTARLSSAYAPIPAAVRKQRCRFRVLALPWIEKTRVAATLDASVDTQASDQVAISAVRNLLTCLAAEAKRVRSEGFIPILVAHVMLGGSVVSTGQVLIGQGIELSPSDLLDVGCEYAACGHIHRSYAWHDGRVAYAGSPQRQNFGETEAKGYRYVTFGDNGKLASNEFVELPARRIELIECDWSTPDGSEALREHGVNATCFALGEARSPATPDATTGDLSGALVRFRYRIRSGDAHLVQRDVLEKIFIADGAHEVKVEPIVVSEARARAPELADAESLPDKLGTYIKAKQLDVSPEQLERLNDKLAVVEGKGVQL